MKTFLIALTIIILLKKNFRNNKLIQKITSPILNFIYYGVQYLCISPIGFLLNIIKILSVYIKDDVVHGKEIYKRKDYEMIQTKSKAITDPNPDDTCPNESRLF